MDILRSNCWLYVHGNTETGTNISLIEAMHLGLPIIAYDDVYIKETTEYKCEYFNSVETLKKAIAHIKFYDLKRIGDKMFEISMNRYSWSLISSLYLRLFLTDKKILNRNKLILSFNTSQQKYLQNQERYQMIYQHFYFEEID
jgi:glycosyltransferase involved in cell wall biosynthesis